MSDTLFLIERRDQEGKWQQEFRRFRHFKELALWMNESHPYSEWEALEAKTCSNSRISPDECEDEECTDEAHLLYAMALMREAEHARWM